MRTVKLSVSSIILVSVLSGCSQQFGSNTQMGSQQIAGSSQLATPDAKISKITLNDYYESEAHRLARLRQLKTTGASQQQLTSANPVVVPTKNIPKPRVKTVKRAVTKAPKVKRFTYNRKPHPRRSVTNTQQLPRAKPGQCFAKVKLPAKYISKTRRILIRKATAKRVLVRATQYRWINKKVLVRKASYKRHIIPARYRTTVVRKMVKPAYLTWKKGHGAITRIDNMTGEIMCRVKIPAVYKIIKKRVLVRPQQVIRTYVPAVYKTVKQKQYVSPAIYKTVKTPAKYKTQRYRIKVGSARYIWRQVLCQTNAPKKYHRKASIKQSQSKKLAAKFKSDAKSLTKYRHTKTNYRHILNTANHKETGYYKIQDKGFNKTRKTAKKSLSKAEKKRMIVYSIQKSLKAQGFDPGVIDGKLGAWTSAALKAFQSSRGLPVGTLNKETFAALGVVINNKES